MCQRPRYRQTHTRIGFIPLYTTKAQFDMCLTPYTQENRSDTLRAVPNSDSSFSKLETMARSGSDTEWRSFKIWKFGKHSLYWHHWYSALGHWYPFGLPVVCIWRSCGAGSVDESIKKIGEQLDSAYLCQGYR